MRKRTITENIKLKGGLKEIQSAPRHEIYLVLDNIRSMYNVGAMFRTADGARVKKIFLCGITATPPRDKIFKTSLGAVDHIEWKYYKRAKTAVENLKKQGVQIVALEQTDDSVHFKKADYRTPVAIVVGHEKKGISRSVLKLADLIVEIPMHGVANSLNVATSCGIIVYEVLSRI